MSPTNYYNMRSHKLNYEIVHTRLDNGIDMKDACTKHYGDYECDIYTPEEIKQKMNVNHVRRLLIIQNYYLDK